MKLAMRTALLCALAVATVPSLALADEPRVHDGFYLRLGIGLGYLHDSATVSGGGSSFDLTLKGMGLPVEVALGGTIAPGLVLGGAIQGGSFPNPNIKLDGGGNADSSDTALMSSLGPFVDYYPDPQGGLHFQGFAGFATLAAQDDEGRSSTNNPTGFALSGGVGQEWFVTDRWSIGVLGRLQYAHVSVSAGGSKETDSVVIPGVLASFTYH